MLPLRLINAPVRLILLLLLACAPACTNFAGYTAVSATDGVYTAAEPPVNKYNDGEYIWYELPVSHYKRTDALFRARPFSWLISNASMNMGRRINEDGTEDEATKLYARREPLDRTPEQLHQFAGKSIFVKQEHSLTNKSDLTYELYRAITANEFEEKLPPSAEKNKTALHSRFLVEPGDKEYSYFPVQLYSAPTQKDNGNLLYISPLLAPLIVVDTVTCLPYWIFNPKGGHLTKSTKRRRARGPSKPRIKKARFKKYTPPPHKSILKGIKRP